MAGLNNMASPDQIPGQGGQELVANAREKIKQEIEQAKVDTTGIQTQLLIEKIKQDLKDAETPAKEVVQVEQVGRFNEKRLEANQVLKSIIKASEAAKAGIRLSKTDKGQNLLIKLADQSLSASTAAAIEVALLKYLLGDKDIDFSQSGQAKTAFEQTFDSLKTTNLLAADIIGNSLISAAKEGKINLSEDEARKRFDVVQYARDLEEEKQKKLKKSYGRFPGEGEALSLTGTEQRRLDQLSNKIERDPKINFNDRKTINDQLKSGQITDEIRVKLATKLSTEEIEEFIDLVEKANRVAKEGGFHCENYMEEADQKKFDVDYLFGNGLVDEKGFTTKGKRELKKALLHSINNLMGKVDAHPDADFQTNYSEFHEGYAYRYIQELVEKLRDNSRWTVHYGTDSIGHQAVMRYINEGLLEEIGRERELRELFHNVGIYIRTLTPDKIKEFMRRYNVSTVSSVATNDFSGKIVSLAMNEYERYLKFDIMKNQGKVRPGLFSGQTNPNLLYFENEDRAKLEERLKNTLIGLQKSIGYDRMNQLTPEQQRKIVANYGLKDLKEWDIDSLLNFEDWELKRALKYAKGLELTQTIRGFEIIASSRPPLTYEGSADNYYDMASFINPNWKWRLGRGVAGWRETHMPEVLIGETIKKRPETSFWKRIFSKGYNPKGIHDKIEAYSEHEMAQKWEHIKDSWLYHDIDFQRLLNKFGLGGLAGRAGWRTVGLREGTFRDHISTIQEAILGAAQKITKEKFNFGEVSRWKDTYDQLTKVVGVGSRFWFDGTRAEDFVKEALWEELDKRHIIHKDELTKDEKNKLWFEYREGKFGDKTIFSLPDGEKYTTMDYLEAKTLVLRGLNFFDLLKRSPMDFLNNIVNLTPELLTQGLGGSTKDIFFEFNQHRLETAIKTGRYNGIDLDLKTSADRENLLRDIEKFQWKQRRIWGKKNFRHLVFIRDFYHKLEDWGAKKENIKDKNSEGIFEEFYKQMDLAVEKVRLRNGPEMKPEDIEDEQLRILIFGKEDSNEQDFKGLVTHFKNLNEDFGERLKDEKWKDLEFGQDGFFYHMARGWYNELGHALHPDTSDVDWRLVFHKLGAKGGESMVRRLWDDLHSWNELMKDLMQLDHMFLEAGHSHNLEKFKELHHKLHNLEGIAGKTAIFEAQFYLAQLVGRYFQENYAARLPFFLGSIYSLFHGKELALSKIYGGRGAMTLTTDGLNGYFQELMHTGIIEEEGQFGFKRLTQALGADWQKLSTTEIIPNIFTALMLFLLWKFIKESLAEAEGKKK